MYESRWNVVQPQSPWYAITDKSVIFSRFFIIFIYCFFLLHLLSITSAQKLCVEVNFSRYSDLRESHVAATSENKQNCLIKTENTFDQLQKKEKRKKKQSRPLESINEYYDCYLNSLNWTTNDGWLLLLDRYPFRWAKWSYRKWEKKTFFSISSINVKSIYVNYVSVANEPVSA